MKTDSLLDEDWSRVVTRLGGAASLDQTARATRAFLRPREIRCAVDLLRLILAYCLGERGLRATAAWDPVPEADRRKLVLRVAALAGTVALMSAPRATRSLTTSSRSADATCASATPRSRAVVSSSHGTASA